MKKNICVLVSVIAFIVLFYHQQPALNLSIFSMLLWGGLFYTTKPQLRNKLFWFLSVLVFVSAIAFAWYGDPLSFLALFASMP